MMSHSENHAARSSNCQVNGVQMDLYKDVQPSRREAMGFAVGIFKGADASATDVIKMAEAIHQFLIGGLRVDLTDDYGKSLFPVKNLAGLPEKIKDENAAVYSLENTPTPV